MSDIKSPDARSKNMRAIKSKDTQPEIFIRKKLFALGYRYRVYRKDIPGKPDLYFPKYNAAVFIHGCFWHRHTNCKYAYSPKSRQEFWETKFSANITRDSIVHRELQERNIRHLIVWECAIKKSQKKGADPNALISHITGFLNSDQQYLEIDVF